VEALTSNIAEWGIETRSVGGEFGCGDDALIHWHSTGGLVAVVDGLGHGPGASAAAQAALEAIKANPQDPLERLLTRCHEATRQTRGLTMAIASIDAQQGQMAWLGVGNVHGSLVRSAPGKEPVLESLLVRSGVVGHRIPPIVPLMIPLAAGDILYYEAGQTPPINKDATNGVRFGYALAAVSSGATTTIAVKIGY